LSRQTNLWRTFDIFKVQFTWIYLHIDVPRSAIGAWWSVYRQICPSTTLIIKIWYVKNASFPVQKADIYSDSHQKLCHILEKWYRQNLVYWAMAWDTNTLNIFSRPMTDNDWIIQIRKWPKDLSYRTYITASGFERSVIERLYSGLRMIWTFQDMYFIPIYPLYRA